MENLLLLNFLTLAISVSAFTYTNILTDAGMILYNLNNRMDSLITGRFRWVYTIVIGCQYCVAGQWALWYYLYFTFIKVNGNYQLELHIWFIMQTIFLTRVITYLYYKMDVHPQKVERVELPSSIKKLTKK